MMTRTVGTACDKRRRAYVKLFVRATALSRGACYLASQSWSRDE